MIKKGIIIITVALQTVLSAMAQQQQLQDTNRVYNSRQIQSRDTTSLLYAFKNGKLNGHVRYFFMSTQNEKGLTDYYANAIGGGIRYETAGFHNFQFAVSGFSIVNIGSSDLTKPDKSTGLYNRYEVGLFDITNPSQKIGLNRLEEFYLDYNIKHSYIRIGRQFINTPFINLQDGRMSPTAVEGVWAEMNEIKKIKIQLGWLWGISPRSTTGWYSPGESIGFYPVGVNADGTKSGYSGNIKSNNIILLQVNSELAKNINLQVWNMYVQNVFNTSMLQMGYTIPLSNNSFLFTDLQAIQQFAVADGGNANQSKTYFLKGSKSLTFGARVGWRNKHWETSLNYNRITSEGRYLAPREWGLDPFFTFLPREKNDGFGNVNAIMGKISYDIPKARLKTSLGAGYYHLPDVKDYALNKYGFTSYSQFDTDINYTFIKALKGLEAEFLIVGKVKNGDAYNNDRFILNKVNMTQYNFVLNYHF
jgi:hypothetical protein